MALTRTKEADLVSDDYEFVTHLAAGTIAAGEMLEANGVSGFAVADAVSGDLVTVVTRASQVRGMKAAVTFSAGQAVYWLDASSVFTTVVTQDIIGYAVEAAATNDATGLINFNGLGKSIIA